MYTILLLDRSSFTKRLQFLSFNKNQVTPSETSNIDGINIKDDEILCIWENTSDYLLNKLPTLLVVNDRSLDDFLAWSATYLRIFRPFTSFFRVIKKCDFCYYNSLIQRHKNDANYFLLASMIITESSFYSNGAFEKTHNTINTHSRTLSFAISQLIVKFGISNITSDMTESLYNNWYSSLSYLGLSRPESSINEVYDIWKLIIAFFSNETSKFNNEQIQSILYEFINTNKSTIIDEYLSSLFSLKKLNFNQKNSRELKVENIISAIFALTNNADKISKQFTCIVIGYLLNFIQPGSLLHSQLLNGIPNTFFSSILWYGLFAGLSSSITFIENGDGIGWSIIKEITRDYSIFDRPISDISIDELRILSSNKDTLPKGIRTSNPGLIRVEVVPTINATFRTFDKEEIQKNNSSDIEQKKQYLSKQGKVNANSMKTIDKQIKTIEDAIITIKKEIDATSKDQEKMLSKQKTLF